MEGRKEENMGNVATRDITCSEGIRRIEEEIKKLSEKADALYEEGDKVYKKGIEYNREKMEINDKNLSEKISKVADAAFVLWNRIYEERKEIRKKIDELCVKIKVMESYDKRLAECNREGKRRRVFVISSVNPLEFRECRICGEDWRSCGHEGNCYTVYDLVSEVGDEDMISHLPDEYFKEK